MTLSGIEALRARGHAGARWTPAAARTHVPPLAAGHLDVVGLGWPSGQISQWDTRIRAGSVGASGDGLGIKLRAGNSVSSADFDTYRTCPRTTRPSARRCARSRRTRSPRMPRRSTRRRAIRRRRTTPWWPATSSRHTSRRSTAAWAPTRSPPASSSRRSPAGAPASSLIPAVNKLGSMPVILGASEARSRPAYLPPLAGGRGGFSYGLSEREAGSDTASHEVPGEVATMATTSPSTARRRGSPMPVSRSTTRSWRSPTPTARAATMSPPSWSRSPTRASPSARRSASSASRAVPPASCTSTTAVIPADRMVGARGRGA
jgi:hypothetical protein